MKIALTPNQMAVFSFMWEYFERNDQLPSAKAMRWHFGWESENTAVGYWKVLERKGWIEKNETGCKYRFKRERVTA
jgi:SOS-response transcriptional repressor LexA